MLLYTSLHTTSPFLILVLKFVIDPGNRPITVVPGRKKKSKVYNAVAMPEPGNDILKRRVDVCQSCENDAARSKLLPSASPLCASTMDEARLTDECIGCLDEDAEETNAVGV